MVKCAWHCCDMDVPDTDRRKRKYCGIKCKNKAMVQRARERVKRKAVAYKGGKCQCCGYSKCSNALEFHHIDPSTKEFSISRDGKMTAWVKVQKELDKCVLVCANCHREIHCGLLKVSVGTVNPASQVQFLGPQL